VPALLAAGRQNTPPIFGAHPLEKPVDAFAASVVRLKRPLHLKNSLRPCSALVLAPVRLQQRNNDPLYRPVRATSRKNSAMGIVLTLSTHVDKPVDNPRGRCPGKPYPGAIPAARGSGGKVAEKFKSARFLASPQTKTACG
jgi:hypothetical protein